MLIRIAEQYFAWEFARIDDVVASLAARVPFTAYPGTTLVRSDGQMANVCLDGRTATLSNGALAEALRLAKEQHLHAFAAGGLSP